MPLGKRADSRYLPVLHIRATRGQTPAFTAQVSLSSSRSSPAHAETNKQDISNFIVVPLQKCKSQNLAGSWDFILGGLKISTKLWKHQNLTRNCMEKCFLILYISLACKFQKLGLTQVSSLKLFLCSSHSFINPAIWKYSSVLDKFWSSFGTIHRINHLWFGEEQSQFSVAWICLITQQKSARGSPGKQVWMWCKRDAMLRSKSYHQELATPQDLNKSLLFSFFDLVNSSKFKSGKKKKSLLPAILENTAAGDHTQESRVLD